MFQRLEAWFDRKIVEIQEELDRRAEQRCLEERLQEHLDLQEREC